MKKEKIIQFWIDNSTMYMLCESGAMYMKALNSSKVQKVKMPSIFAKK